MNRFTEGLLLALDAAVYLLSVVAFAAALVVGAGLIVQWLGP